MVICPNCGEENPEKFRLCGFCGTALSPPVAPQEVRKLVTILFCDLKGSTSLAETLDSESLREVMGLYFDAMSDAITAHGGTIEKFIGDAVMAVFGLPRVREDDALRAVRAAAAMQSALVELNGELERRHGVTLSNRIGVNTGEVVAGDATAGQRLVTGDPVNVAARLEQAAGDYEALLGGLTYRLVRDSVTVEPVEPLELKGKAERVSAYRLLSATRREEQLAALPSLQGRDEELAAIAAELELVVRERWARLVTLLAEPGVGKSRLIAEVQRRADARFVTGRCLSYGRGITFWPLVEIARQLAGIDESDSPEAASQKLLAQAAGDGRVAERLAAVMGLGDRQFAVEETFWAARRLLEIAASERPLVVCVEDIQWAEQTLLDLLENVLETAADSAILMICAARASVLEIRPGWGERGKVLTLEPLGADHSEAIVREALGGAELAESVVAQIVDAAEGNPLYVMQIVSMLLEEGALPEMRIPPTIQALLAARLDLLSAAERAVLESASVVGQRFSRPAVEALVPEAVKPDVAVHLESLTRKRLVRPEVPLDEEAYRFDHVLIRDTTYQSLLKRARATLHERLVEWARDRSTEDDEILGYHLEQAHGYLAELGPLDDHGRDLGVRGAQKLEASGRRAFVRGDMPAAANLLRRAVALRAPEDRERHRLMPLVAEALMEIGEFAWAETLLDEAVTYAGDDPRLLANVELTRLFVQHRVTEDLSGWCSDVLAVTDRTIPVLERMHAHEELARAWRLLVYVHGIALHYGRQAEASERAVVHARAAGDHRLEARLTAGYTIAICEGPTPVPEAIEICRGVLARNPAERQGEAITRCSLASLLAMASRIDEARVEYAAARELLVDLGGALPAYASIAAAGVELLAGNAEDVARDLRVVYGDLGRLGERFFRPLVGALLAEALQRCGDTAGGMAQVAEVAEQADASDVETWALLESARASGLASAGEPTAAVDAARRAVDLLADTDAPVAQAHALVRLGETLAAAGRPVEARRELETARHLYERKGNVAAAGLLSDTAAQLA